MQFYNLNIKYKNKITKQRESHSRVWLDEHKEAPIFFGQSKIDEILSNKFDYKGRSLSEAKTFCKIGQGENIWKEVYIVTIDGGNIWIYQPCGMIHESTSWENYQENVKSFPIELVKKLQIKEIPLILASMKINQAFSRGTFAEIKPDKYFGNILAIRYLLGNKVANFELPNEFSLLDCLSSLELETLIAKIFEANGCFVPAYKGGYMKDIDLIVSNYSKRDIFIDGLLIPKNIKKDIQVKLRFGNSSKNKNLVADYNIGLDLVTKEKNFGRDWILKQIENPQIKEWFNHSIEWTSAVLGAKN